MQDDEEKKDDLKEEGIHELMDEFDLSEKQALKVEKLEGEGYDEEDAVSKAMDEVE